MCTQSLNHYDLNKTEHKPENSKLNQISKKSLPCGSRFVYVSTPSKQVLPGLESELMLMYQELLSVGWDSRNTTENAALSTRLRQCCQRTTVLKLR